MKTLLRFNPKFYLLALLLITGCAQQPTKVTTPADSEHDIKMQFYAGLKYAKGDGLPQDTAKAIKWLTKSAENGYAPAQYNLGVIYSDNKLIQQDNKKALYWYTKAAEQGFAEAQNNLGSMYLKGRGVQQDNHKAIHWLTQAAEQGLSKTQYHLGLMYAKGEVVTRDYVLAYMWWSMAIHEGLQPVNQFRDKLVQEGMTPAQIERAQQLSQTCIEKGFKGCGE